MLLVLLSHFNVNLLTECGKKSVFIWHRNTKNVTRCRDSRSANILANLMSVAQMTFIMYSWGW